MQVKVEVGDRVILSSVYMRGTVEERKGKVIAIYPKSDLPYRIKYWNETMVANFSRNEFQPIKTRV